MALIDLLQATQPSQLPTTGYGNHPLNITNESYNHGGDIPTNPQADGIFSPANKTSIHSDNGDINRSYSLNGTNVQGAQNIFNAYNLPPGLMGLSSNQLPLPAILDLDSATPIRPPYFTTDRTNTDFD
jgi:hypothetical protein